MGKSFMNKRGAGSSAQSQSGKKRLSNVTLKFKLLVWFIALGVIPAVTVAFIVFSASENALENQVEDMSEEIAGQVGENINQQIDQVYDLSMRPFTDGDVYEQLVANFSNMDQMDVFTARREVTDYFSSIRNSTDYLDEMFFYREQDGEVLGRVRGEDMGDAPFTDEVRDLLDSNTFVWHTEFGEDGSLRMVLYRSVNQGILGLELSERMFDDILDRERIMEEIPERLLFIANQDGQILRSNNHEIETISGEEVAQDDVIMSHIELENDWYAVVSTPRDVVMSEMNALTAFVIALVVGFIIAAVAIAFFVTSSVTRPISNMIRLMKQAEDGDLTVRTHETGKNEMGQLGTSFNRMLQNVSHIIAENKSVTTVAKENTEQMKRIADQSSHTADQIASSIQEVANGAMEQVNYAERTSQEMEELSTEMTRMGEAVGQVTKVANNTKTSSANSLGYMNELTVKNEDVGENIGQIKIAIEKLSQDVEGIRNVVEIIDGISDQTNLLALNASIEAARAGEAGKGFAVVADEVRKLAEQSKQSTGKIDGIVSTILGQTKDSVKLVTASVALFEEQAKSVEETKASFGDIMTDTEDIFTAVESMERSIETMSEKREQVEKAIGDMAEITESTSASTEEVSATTQEQFAAAEELGKLSDILESTMTDLEEVVNRFQVDDSEPVLSEPAVDVPSEPETEPEEAVSEDEGEFEEHPQDAEPDEADLDDGADEEQREEATGNEEEDRKEERGRFGS